MKRFLIFIAIFCSHLQVAGQADLSISGTVYQGSGSLSNGIVLAINRDNNTTTIGKVTTGAFEVDSLYEGNYILYALPDPANKAYLPTFFVNSQNPSQASSIDLIGFVTGVEIFLLQRTVSESGTSILNLRFYYQDFSSDASTDFRKKWFNLPTPPSTISIGGAPCQNLPVLLYNQQNQIVDWGITDNQGYVQFKNLAGGTYYARGQRYDYLTQSNGSVVVTANATLAKSLWLTRTPITSTENATIGSTALAYPNPFHDQLQLSGYKESITITDLTGSVYYSNLSFSQQTITTTNWPKGIYLLKAGDKVHKVLKY